MLSKRKSRTHECVRLFDLAIYFRLSRPNTSTDRIIARSYGTEPVLILRTGDKRTHHSSIVILNTIIQHIQPEVIPTIFRVSSQVTEVLHRHKRFVVLGALKCCIFCHLPHYSCSPTCLQSRKQCRALRCEINRTSCFRLNSRNQCINERIGCHCRRVSSQELRSLHEQISKLFII